MILIVQTLIRISQSLKLSSLLCILPLTWGCFGVACRRREEGGQLHSIKSSVTILCNFKLKRSKIYKTHAKLRRMQCILPHCFSYKEIQSKFAILVIDCCVHEQKPLHLLLSILIFLPSLMLTRKKKRQIILVCHTRFRKLQS